MNHVAHILASVFLCGLWLPMWAILALTYSEPWHCSRCGYCDAVKYLRDPYMRAREAEAQRIRAEQQNRDEQEVLEPSLGLTAAQKGVIFAVSCVVIAGGIVIAANLNAEHQKRKAANLQAFQNAHPTKSSADIAKEKERSSLIARIRAAYGAKYKEFRVGESGVGSPRLFITTPNASPFIKEFQKSLYFKEAPSAGFTSVRINDGKVDWVHEFK